MKHKLLFISFLLGTILAYSQGNKTYLNGYSETIEGTNFTYHSPIPDVNSSLLLRGRSDYKSLEWKTEEVPADYKGKFISFIWVYAMDVTLSPADFVLSVNDKKWFHFSSSKVSEKGSFKMEGENGAELLRKVTMLDIHKDQMGFMILKLPVDAIKLGEVARIKISTTSEDNNAWFMLYKTDVNESIDIYQNKVVAKQDGDLFHSISVDFVHISEDAKAQIIINDFQTETSIKAGFNKVEILLPKVEQEETFTAQIKIEGQDKHYIDFKLKPIKEWTIFLVQHTHTDIGYTRPQTECLPEHLRYIDHALDYCDQTDDYPEDAQFRWTCETSWSVREYLRSRPQAQIDRLLQRLKEGRIEATGMFLNYSEIIDEPALAAQTKTLKFLKNKGINVTTAMQNDVNGIAWCMVDYYNNTSVKYLNMGVHAHRARKPFIQPTSFWWKSPAGNRLLAYRSEHYQHANTLGITSGQMDILRNNLSNYLTGLEEKDYPYDKISLQFSGYQTDNSPPSVAACDIIKEWNEKYEWPKLRSSLARDFMIFLDEQHADDLPEQKVAWPDWWTDGVGSAANETKVVRETHVNISSISAILSMGKILGLELPQNIQTEIEEVYDNLLFYDEHTHGAAESVSDPLCENTINQWNMKSAYAWEASKKYHAVEEKVLAFIEPALHKSSEPTIAVFNTLNWERSGIVDLFLENELLVGAEHFSITDINGNNVPYQSYQQRSEGAYYKLWVENIPAMGFKTLKINVDEKPAIDPTLAQNIFENEFYQIELDQNNGIISRIFDKQLEKELIDPNDTLSLGQFIYEELDNRHELERLTATNRDTVYKPIGMNRSILKNVKMLRDEKGAIYNSIFLNGNIPVCADERGVNIEIRLYHYQKKIELLYSMIKLPVTDPEGVYVSFPFQLEEGQLAFEAQGGVVYPGKNQLEGTSADWNTIQNFAAVKTKDAQIVFVSDETPLVQFGAINTGRYYYRLKPQTNHIYSWVMNNYWVTNFKSSQGGEFQWSYQITSDTDQSDMFATKFGWGERVPLKSRIMLPTFGAETTELEQKSILNLDVPNLLLVNASIAMDQSGIVLHLREVEGDHAIVDIRRLLQETGATAAYEVNILEENLKQLSAPLLIEHFETKFIKLEFE